MYNNDIFKIQYNQSFCKDARLLSYGQMTSPSFKAKGVNLPKNAEKQITDEALKIASAAIAASGIVYIGEHPKSKLTRTQQEEIIEKYRQGNCNVYKEYGCSDSTVLKLINLQPNAEELKEESKKNRAKITIDEENVIVNRYILGERFEKIADEYGVSTSCIKTIINKQKNKKDNIAKRRQNSKKLSEQDEKDIIERYQTTGESLEKIAKDYACSVGTIRNLISNLANADEVKTKNKTKSTFFTPEQQEKIIQMYINGASYETIAKQFSCSQTPVKNILIAQPNWHELQELKAKNSATFKPEEEAVIIKRFRNGEPSTVIARDYNCSARTISALINKQPNKEEIKAENKKNNENFTPAEKAEIIERFKNGESYAAIGASFGISESVIRKFIKNQPDSEEIKKSEQKIKRK